MPGEPNIQRFEPFRSHRPIGSVEAEGPVRERVIALLVAYLDFGIIGVGNNARVFSEPADRADGAWCAKDATTAWGRTVNLPPRDEIRVQEAAYRALATARAADPATPLARVPEPIAYVEAEHRGEPHRLIIMG